MRGWGSVLGLGRLCSPRPTLPTSPHPPTARPPAPSSWARRACGLVSYAPADARSHISAPGSEGQPDTRLDWREEGAGGGSPRRGGLWGLPGPPRAPSASPKAVCPLHTALPVSSSLFSGDLLTTHWPRPQRDVTP